MKSIFPASGFKWLVDVGIAVLAGFLILPAMYVAAERGVMIFNEAGGLLSKTR